MIRVAPSGWAGQGLFATRSIPAQTAIVAYQGERIDKAESARRKAAHNNYIFRLNYAWDIDGSGLDNLARYLNHSCDPNCRAEIRGEQIWIVADRDIAPGEELSFNYGFDLTDYQRFPCSCGARVCCGYMLAREFWGELPREVGEGTFSAWGEGTGCEQ
ncbi:MAG: SET domain-containing protein-lysine N-methyltransferase [Vulcanimicrobiota bacterium]